MRILAITNLYPRPDQPSRGMFNAQLFAEMAKLVDVRVLCLVPEWRVWRWKRIRECGVRSSDVRGLKTEVGPYFAQGFVGQGAEGRGPRTEDRGQRTENGVEVTYVPVFYVPLVGRTFSSMTYWWSLRGLVSEFSGKCDAVYASWLYPDGVAGAMMARRLGVPSWTMVLGSDTFHLESSARRRAIVDACGRGEVICVAAHLKDRMVEAGVDPARAHFLPNGVDCNLFRRRPREEALGQLVAAMREEIHERSTFNVQRSALSVPKSKACNESGIVDFLAGIAPAKHVVLFVGNLVHVKGPDILLEAFAKMIRKSEVGSQRSEVGLVVIGDGLMRKRLQVRANELGVADSVHFLGSRPHQEIALWMNAADVLCLPSRSEGMPNVLLEAVAGGLPFAAADVGACSEIHRQYGGGVIFKPEDAGSLEAALADCLAGRYKERSSRAVRTWSDSARDVVDLMSADTNSAPVCRNG